MFSHCFIHSVVANLTSVCQVTNLPNNKGLGGGVFLCEFKHSDKKNFLLFS